MFKLILVKTKCKEDYNESFDKGGWCHFCVLDVMFSLCAQGTNEVAENGNTIIHVAHFYDPTDENGYNWFNKAKEEFEAENPGIKVEFEQFKWDEIDIKLMSDFRSNILTHDVALSTPQLLPQHAAVGTFEDLNPYLKNTGHRMKRRRFPGLLPTGRENRAENKLVSSGKPFPYLRVQQRYVQGRRTRSRKSAEDAG